MLRFKEGQIDVSFTVSKWRLGPLKNDDLFQGIIS